LDRSASGCPLNPRSMYSMPGKYRQMVPSGLITMIPDGWLYSLSIGSYSYRNPHAAVNASMLSFFPVRKCQPQSASLRPYSVTKCIFLARASPGFSFGSKLTQTMLNSFPQVIEAGRYRQASSTPPNTSPQSIGQR
jgi:hypothetical protein